MLMLNSLLPTRQGFLWEQDLKLLLFGDGSFFVNSSNTEWIQERSRDVQQEIIV